MGRRSWQGWERRRKRRRRQGRRPRVAGWTRASSAPGGDCRAAVMLQSHGGGWGETRRRGLGIQAPLLPRSPGTSRPLPQALARPVCRGGRGGSLVRHAADPRWPLGTWSGAVERPLSRPTSIPVGPGIQGDQSPREQVERARGGLRPSDSLWCRRGHRQHALFLVFGTFFGCQFSFLRWVVGFCVLSPTSGEALQVDCGYLRVAQITNVCSKKKHRAC